MKVDTTAAVMPATVLPPSANRPDASLIAQHTDNTSVTTQGNSVEAGGNSDGAIKHALDMLNEWAKKINIDTNVSFSLDHSTGKTVVKVTDIDTQEVLRQFPSDDILSMVRALDHLQGIFVREKA